MQGLPPLPRTEGQVIHLQTPQGQAPPLSVAELRAMLGSGRLPPDARIWFQGLPGWIRPQDHPELAGHAPAASPDDERDRVFVDLIKASWAYYHAHEAAAHVDEVFLGAVITSALDNGFSLIDLNSDGAHHYLRFEDMRDHSRIVFQLQHLTSGLLASKVLGQMASVVVGYGERSADFSRVWQALKAEYKSGYLSSPEPGTITVDGDVGSGYVYVQVDMFWNIGDYVGEAYAIRYDRLSRDVGACVHALRKYLRGRVGG